MIKQILEYLGFCTHHWKIFEKVFIYKYDALEPHEVVFMQQCTKCGKLHKLRVK